MRQHETCLLNFLLLNSHLFWPARRPCLTPSHEEHEDDLIKRTDSLAKPLRTSVTSEVKKLLTAGDAEERGGNNLTIYYTETVR
jgi:hypothetical protein